MPRSKLIKRQHSHISINDIGFQYRAILVGPFLLLVVCNKQESRNTFWKTSWFLILPFWFLNSFFFFFGSGLWGATSWRHSSQISKGSFRSCCLSSVGWDVWASPDGWIWLRWWTWTPANSCFPSCRLERHCFTRSSDGMTRLGDKTCSFCRNAGLLGCLYETLGRTNAASCVRPQQDMQRCHDSNQEHFFVLRCGKDTPPMPVLLREIKWTCLTFEQSMPSMRFRVMFPDLSNMIKDPII